MMSFRWNIVRWLFVRAGEPPKLPRTTETELAMSSEDQREKVIKLLLTAQMLAVDLGDRALVDKINKAIAEARQGHVRQA